jgi:ACS family glucarate transporter-like MFS transporter
MDIGGSRSGAVSGSMNMIGNLGAALSAVLFPYCTMHVTIPVLAPELGTPNSFFVVAAIVNLCAMVAWIAMNPQRRVKELSSRSELTWRFIGFLALIVIVVSALVYTKFFMGSG